MKHTSYETPHYAVFSNLMSKYSPQQSVLRNWQSILFP